MAVDRVKLLVVSNGDVIRSNAHHATWRGEGRGGCGRHNERVSLPCLRIRPGIEADTTMRPALPLLPYRAPYCLCSLCTSSKRLPFCDWRRSQKSVNLAATGPGMVHRWGCATKGTRCTMACRERRAQRARSDQQGHDLGCLASS